MDGTGISDEFGVARHLVNLEVVHLRGYARHSRIDSRSRHNRYRSIQVSTSTAIFPNCVPDSSCESAARTLSSG
jgi:hypothetical protein